MEKVYLDVGCDDNGKIILTCNGARVENVGGLEYSESPVLQNGRVSHFTRNANAKILLDLLPREKL